MKTLIALSAALVLGLGGSAVAGTPDASTSQTPVLDGATAAPDCGNLNGLAGQAFCVSAPLGSIGALADAYVADYTGRGWLAAGGEDNRLVLVRRRESGGCDAVQMLAFYDTSVPAGPETTGYLGFAAIPGNVCTVPVEAPAGEAAQ